MSSLINALLSVLNEKAYHSLFFDKQGNATISFTYRFDKNLLSKLIKRVGNNLGEEYHNYKIKRIGIGYAFREENNYAQNKDVSILRLLNELINLYKLYFGSKKERNEATEYFDMNYTDEMLYNSSKEDFLTNLLMPVENIAGFFIYVVFESRDKNISNLEALRRHIDRDLLSDDYASYASAEDFIKMTRDGVNIKEDEIISFLNNLKRRNIRSRSPKENFLQTSRHFERGLDNLSSHNSNNSNQDILVPGERINKNNKEHINKLKFL